MCFKKRCPHCLVLKDENDFSPRASWCKLCINTREKEKRERERSSLGLLKYQRKEPAVVPTHKNCSICSHNKTIEHFPIGSNRCKECKNISEREKRKSDDYVPPKRTPEYAAWCEMRKRCLSESHPAYADYGGRGIEIDPRWNSFSNFLDDVGHRPSPDLSLDRKDNDGHYTKDNCKWSTRTEQARNRRSNRLVEYNGRKITAIELSEYVGASVSTIYRKLNEGLTGDEIARS